MWPHILDEDIFYVIWIGYDGYIGYDSRYNRYGRYMYCTVPTVQWFTGDDRVSN